MACTDELTELSDFDQVHKANFTQHTVVSVYVESAPPHPPRQCPVYPLHKSTLGALSHGAKIKRIQELLYMMHERMREFLKALEEN